MLEAYLMEVDSLLVKVKQSRHDIEALERYEFCWCSNLGARSRALLYGSITLLVRARVCVCSESTLMLDVARNRLHRMELWFTLITMALAFGAFIASLFGMNLQNGYAS